MVCSKPFFLKNQGFYVPCGKCLGCRINTRGAWVTRMVLESSNYHNTTFLTLTYDDENLPINGDLVPSQLTSWLKRFRKSIDPLKVRYFACGEYGEKFGRPHYHAILFGVDSITTTFHASKTWTFGHVYAVPATIETMSYVGGYVAKKIMRLQKNDAERDRVPEFCRTSRKPGLGVVSLGRLFRLCSDPSSGGDVVDGIHYNGKYHPLPRFIKEKLRASVYSEEYRELLKRQRISQAKRDALDMYKKQPALKQLSDNYRVQQVNYDISHLQKRTF